MADLLTISFTSSAISGLIGRSASSLSFSCEDMAVYIRTSMPLHSLSSKPAIFPAAQSRTQSTAKNPELYSQFHYPITLPSYHASIDNRPQTYVQQLGEDASKHSSPSTAPSKQSLSKGDLNTPQTTPSSSPRSDLRYLYVSSFAGTKHLSMPQRS